MPQQPSEYSNLFYRKLPTLDFDGAVLGKLDKRAHAFIAAYEGTSSERGAISPFNQDAIVFKRPSSTSQRTEKEELLSSEQSISIPYYKSMLTIAERKRFCKLNSERDTLIDEYNRLETQSGPDALKVLKAVSFHLVRIEYERNVIRKTSAMRRDASICNKTAPSRSTQIDKMSRVFTQLRVAQNLLERQKVELGHTIRQLVEKIKSIKGVKSKEKEARVLREELKAFDEEQKKIDPLKQRMAGKLKQLRENYGYSARPGKSVGSTELTSKPTLCREIETEVNALLEAMPNVLQQSVKAITDFSIQDPGTDFDDIDVMRYHGYDDDELLEAYKCILYLRKSMENAHEKMTRWVKYNYIFFAEKLEDHERQQIAEKTEKALIEIIKTQAALLNEMQTRLGLAQSSEAGFSFDPETGQVLFESDTAFSRLQSRSLDVHYPDESTQKHTLWFYEQADFSNKTSLGSEGLCTVMRRRSLSVKHYNAFHDALERFVDQYAEPEVVNEPSGNSEKTPLLKPEKSMPAGFALSRGYANKFKDNKVAQEERFNPIEAIRILFGTTHDLFSRVNNHKKTKHFYRLLQLPSLRILLFRLCSLQTDVELKKLINTQGIGALVAHAADGDQFILDVLLKQARAEYLVWCKSLPFMASERRGLRNALDKLLGVKRTFGFVRKQVLLGECAQKINEAKPKVLRFTGERLLAEVKRMWEIFFEVPRYEAKDVQALLLPFINYMDFQKICTATDGQQFTKSFFDPLIARLQDEPPLPKAIRTNIKAFLGRLESCFGVKQFPEFSADNFHLFEQQRAAIADVMEVCDLRVKDEYLEPSTAEIEEGNVQEERPLGLKQRLSLYFAGAEQDVAKTLTQGVVSVYMKEYLFSVDRDESALAFNQTILRQKNLNVNMIKFIASHAASQGGIKSLLATTSINQESAFYGDAVVHYSLVLKNFNHEAERYVKYSVAGEVAGSAMYFSLQKSNGSTEEEIVPCDSELKPFNGAIRGVEQPVVQMANGSAYQGNNVLLINYHIGFSELDNIEHRQMRKSIRQYKSHVRENLRDYVEKFIFSANQAQTNFLSLKDMKHADITTAPKYLPLRHHDIMIAMAQPCDVIDYAYAIFKYHVECGNLYAVRNSIFANGYDDEPQNDLYQFHLGHFDRTSSTRQSAYFHEDDRMISRCLDDVQFNEAVSRRNESVTGKTFTVLVDEFLLNKIQLTNYIVIPPSVASADEPWTFNLNFVRIVCRYASVDVIKVMHEKILTELFCLPVEKTAMAYFLRNYLTCLQQLYNSDRFQPFQVESLLDAGARHLHAQIAERLPVNPADGCESDESIDAFYHQFSNKSDLFDYFGREKPFNTSGETVYLASPSRQHCCYKYETIRSYVQDRYELQTNQEVSEFAYLRQEGSDEGYFWDKHGEANFKRFVCYLYHRFLKSDDDLFTESAIPVLAHIFMPATEYTVDRYKQKQYKTQFCFSQYVSLLFPPNQEGPLDLEKIAQPVGEELTPTTESGFARLWLEAAERYEMKDVIDATLKKLTTLQVSGDEAEEKRRLTLLISEQIATERSGMINKKLAKLTILEHMFLKKILQLYADLIVSEYEKKEYDIDKLIRNSARLEHIVSCFVDKRQSGGILHAGNQKNFDPDNFVSSSVKEQLDEISKGLKPLAAKVLKSLSCIFDEYDSQKHDLFAVDYAKAGRRRKVAISVVDDGAPYQVICTEAHQKPTMFSAMRTTASSTTAVSGSDISNASKSYSMRVSRDCETLFAKLDLLNSKKPIVLDLSMPHVLGDDGKACVVYNNAIFDNITLESAKNLHKFVYMTESRPDFVERFLTQLDSLITRIAEIVDPGHPYLLALRSFKAVVIRGPEAEKEHYRKIQEFQLLYSSCNYLFRQLYFGKTVAEAVATQLSLQSRPESELITVALFDDKCFSALETSQGFSLAGRKESVKAQWFHPVVVDLMSRQSGSLDISPLLGTAYPDRPSTPESERKRRKDASVPGVISSALDPQAQSNAMSTMKIHFMTHQQKMIFVREFISDLTLNVEGRTEPDFKEAFFALNGVGLDDRLRHRADEVLCHATPVRYMEHCAGDKTFHPIGDLTLLPMHAKRDIIDRAMRALQYMRSVLFNESDFSPFLNYSAVVALKMMVPKLCKLDTSYHQEIVHVTRDVKHMLLIELNLFDKQSVSQSKLFTITQQRYNFVNRLKLALNWLVVFGGANEKEWLISLLSPLKHAFCVFGSVTDISENSRDFLVEVVGLCKHISKICDQEDDYTDYDRMVELLGEGCAENRKDQKRVTIAKNKVLKTTLHRHQYRKALNKIAAHLAEKYPKHFALIDFLNRYQLSSFASLYSVKIEGKLAVKYFLECVDTVSCTRDEFYNEIGSPLGLKIINYWLLLNKAIKEDQSICENAAIFYWQDTDYTSYGTAYPEAARFMHCATDSEFEQPFSKYLKWVGGAAKTNAHNAEVLNRGEIRFPHKYTLFVAKLYAWFAARNPALNEVIEYMSQYNLMTIAELLTSNAGPFHNQTLKEFLVSRGVLSANVARALVDPDNITTKTLQAMLILMHQKQVLHDQMYTFNESQALEPDFINKYGLRVVAGDVAAGSDQLITGKVELVELTDRKERQEVRGTKMLSLSAQVSGVIEEWQQELPPYLQDEFDLQHDNLVALRRQLTLPKHTSVEWDQRLFELNQLKHQFNALLKRGELLAARKLFNNLLVVYSFIYICEIFDPIVLVEACESLLFSANTPVKILEDFFSKECQLYMTLVLYTVRYYDNDLHRDDRGQLIYHKNVQELNLISYESELEIVMGVLECLNDSRLDVLKNEGSVKQLLEMEISNINTVLRHIRESISSLNDVLTQDRMYRYAAIEHAKASALQALVDKLVALEYQSVQQNNIAEILEYIAEVESLMAQFHTTMKAEQHKLEALHRFAELQPTIGSVIRADKPQDQEFERIQQGLGDAIGQEIPDEVIVKHLINLLKIKGGDGVGKFSDLLAYAAYSRHEHGKKIRKSLVCLLKEERFLKELVFAMIALKPDYYTQVLSSLKLVYEAILGSFAAVETTTSVNVGTLNSAHSRMVERAYVDSDGLINEVKGHEMPVTHGTDAERLCKFIQTLVTFTEAFNGIKAGSDGNGERADFYAPYYDVMLSFTFVRDFVKELVGNLSSLVGVVIAENNLVVQQASAKHVQIPIRLQECLTQFVQGATVGSNQWSIDYVLQNLPQLRFKVVQYNIALANLQNPSDSYERLVEYLATVNSALSCRVLASCQHNIAELQQYMFVEPMCRELGEGELKLSNCRENRAKVVEESLFAVFNDFITHGMFAHAFAELIELMKHNVSRIDVFAALKQLDEKGLSYANLVESELQSLVRTDPELTSEKIKMLLSYSRHLSQKERLEAKQKISEKGMFDEQDESLLTHARSSIKECEKLIATMKERSGLLQLLKLYNEALINDEYGEDFISEQDSKIADILANFEAEKNRLGDFLSESCLIVKRPIDTHHVYHKFWLLPDYIGEAEGEKALNAGKYSDENMEYFLDLLRDDSVALEAAQQITQYNEKHDITEGVFNLSVIVAMLKGDSGVAGILRNHGANLKDYIRRYHEQIRISVLRVNMVKLVAILPDVQSFRESFMHIHRHLQELSAIDTDLGQKLQQASEQLGKLIKFINELFSQSNPMRFGKILKDKSELRCEMQKSQWAHVQNLLGKVNEAITQVDILFKRELTVFMVQDDVSIALENATAALQGTQALNCPPVAEFNRCPSIPCFVLFVKELHRSTFSPLNIEALTGLTNRYGLAFRDKVFQFIVSEGAVIAGKNIKGPLLSDEELQTLVNFIYAYGDSAESTIAAILKQAKAEVEAACKQQYQRDYQPRYYVATQARWYAAFNQNSHDVAQVKFYAAQSHYVLQAKKFMQGFLEVIYEYMKKKAKSLISFDQFYGFVKLARAGVLNGEDGALKRDWDASLDGQAELLGIARQYQIFYSNIKGDVKPGSQTNIRFRLAICLTEIAKFSDEVQYDKMFADMPVEDASFSFDQEKFTKAQEVYIVHKTIREAILTRLSKTAKAYSRGHLADGREFHGGLLSWPEVETAVDSLQDVKECAHSYSDQVVAEAESIKQELQSMQDELPKQADYIRLCELCESDLSAGQSDFLTDTKLRQELENFRSLDPKTKAANFSVHAGFVTTYVSEHVKFNTILCLVKFLKERRFTLGALRPLLDLSQVTLDENFSQQQPKLKFYFGDRLGAAIFTAIDSCLIDSVDDMTAKHQHNLELQINNYLDASIMPLYSTLESELRELEFIDSQRQNSFALAAKSALKYAIASLEDHVVYDRPLHTSLTDLSNQYRLLGLLLHVLQNDFSEASQFLKIIPDSDLRELLSNYEQDKEGDDELKFSNTRNSAILALLDKFSAVIPLRQDRQSRLSRAVGADGFKAQTASECDQLRELKNLTKEYALESDLATIRQAYEDSFAAYSREPDNIAIAQALKEQEGRLISHLKSIFMLFARQAREQLQVMIKHNNAILQQPAKKKARTQTREAVYADFACVHQAKTLEQAIMSTKYHASLSTIGDCDNSKVRKCVYKRQYQQFTDRANVLFGYGEENVLAPDVALEQSQLGCLRGEFEQIIAFRGGVLGQTEDLPKFPNFEEPFVLRALDEEFERSSVGSNASTPTRRDLFMTDREVPRSATRRPRSTPSAANFFGPSEFGTPKRNVGDYRKQSPDVSFASTNGFGGSK